MFLAEIRNDRFDTHYNKHAIKIPSDECVGVVLDNFFDSTAKTLVIYSEFWYFSRIFPTLFSQLISIFISLPTHGSFCKQIVIGSWSLLSTNPVFLAEIRNDRFDTHYNKHAINYNLHFEASGIMLVNFSVA